MCDCSSKVRSKGPVECVASVGPKLVIVVSFVVSRFLPIIRYRCLIMELIVGGAVFVGGCSNVVGCIMS